MRRLDDASGVEGVVPVAAPAPVAAVDVAKAMIGARVDASLRASFPSFFADVVEFQKAMRLVHRDRAQMLPPDDWNRRIRLILEELSELATAHAAGDLVEFSDALVDLVWVVLGTAVEAGVPFEDVWAEVRRANMAKAGGVLDASGKLQKPAGWTPPDVALVLARHQALCGVRVEGEHRGEDAENARMEAAFSKAFPNWGAP